jgi:hypothetical protein
MLTLLRDDETCIPVLDLSGNLLSDVCVSDIAKLSPYPISLNLNSNRFTERGIALLIWLEDENRRYSYTLEQNPIDWSYFPWKWFFLITAIHLQNVSLHFIIRCRDT